MILTILLAQAQPKLYVTSSTGNDVVIVDPATNRVLAREGLGPEPHGLAVPARQNVMFFTIEHDGADEGELVWFDPVADRETRRIKVGPRPNQLAVTPDGRLAYVPCDDASWWVIDTTRGVVVTKIATGGRPHNTLCSPDGQLMYLAPKGSYFVFVCDTRTHKVSGRIQLPDAPRPIALSRDGRRLYANVDTLIGFVVADSVRQRLLMRVEAEVPSDLLHITSRSHGIGLTPDEKELWTCDVFRKLIYVFDLVPERPRQVATIRTESAPYWLCFSPDGSRCYVSQKEADMVAVVDTASRKITAQIPVGSGPKRLAIVTPPGPQPGR